MSTTKVAPTAVGVNGKSFHGADFGSRLGNYSSVSTMLERFQWVLENRTDLGEGRRGGWGMAAWSLRAGMSRSQVERTMARLREKPDFSPESVTMEKLAAAAEVPGKWLAFGEGDPNELRHTERVVVDVRLPAELLEVLDEMNATPQEREDVSRHRGGSGAQYTKEQWRSYVALLRGVAAQRPAARAELEEDVDAEAAEALAARRAELAAKRAGLPYGPVPSDLKIPIKKPSRSEPKKKSS